MTKIFGKNYQNLVGMTIGIGHVTKIFCKNYQNLVVMTIGIGRVTNFWSNLPEIKNHIEKAYKTVLQAITIRSKRNF